MMSELFRVSVTAASDHPVKVQNQAGFVLHTRPFSETSLLVDIFTLDYGRVRCVAKGFRKPNKKGISRALFPFTRHVFSWQGRSDLKTLTQSDAVGSPAILHGKSMFIGLYINELLYRLLHEYDPHEYLFEYYQALLIKLAAAELIETDLRQLEIKLLDELGYGLALDSESLTGEVISAEKYYRYIPDQGLVRIDGSNASSSGGFLGADLMALKNNDLRHSSAHRAAKHLLRSVIDFYLDGRELHSRELYRQFLISEQTPEGDK